LLAGAALKLPPLIVTLEPAVAEAGLKESGAALKFDSKQAKRMATVETK
jgi:hypothetical protein